LLKQQDSCKHFLNKATQGRPFDGFDKSVKLFGHLCEMFALEVNLLISII